MHTDIYTDAHASALARSIPRGCGHMGNAGDTHTSPGPKNMSASGRVSPPEIHDKSGMKRKGR